MKRAKLITYLGIGVSVPIIVIIGYFLWGTVRTARGVSKTADAPTYLIRLQVVNGTDTPAVAAEVTRALSHYADSVLEIQIAGTMDFDLKKVEKSFIISREKDESAAKELAKLLGLDPSETMYKPLEFNEKHITVTLVLGEDAPSLKLPNKEQKNKER